jgi:hypothetical protein
MDFKLPDLLLQEEIQKIIYFAAALSINLKKNIDIVIILKKFQKTVFFLEGEVCPEVVKIVYL